MIVFLTFQIEYSQQPMLSISQHRVRPWSEETNSSEPLANYSKHELEVSLSIQIPGLALAAWRLKSFSPLFQYEVGLMLEPTLFPWREPGAQLNVE